MTIKNLDRAAMRILSDEINAALAPLAQQHGITLRIGRGTFAGAYAKFTLDVATLGTNGVPATQEAVALGSLGDAYGLEGVQVGACTIIRGVEYRVVGLNAKARKAPVNLERVSDGTTFKAPVNLVKQGLMPATAAE